MVILRDSEYELELEELSLKEKLIYTFRIWFGMKVTLKIKWRER